MSRRGNLFQAMVAAVLLVMAPFAWGNARAESPHKGGTVTGTAVGTGASAARPTTPLAGVVVLLVPRSEALLSGLERIKRGARESMAAYRSAILEMQQLVQTSLSAGDGATISSAAVDEAGRFALADVPPGDWILIGRRGLYVDRGSKDTRLETGTYLARPRLVGYERVTLWLQPVSVEAGGRYTVELTDRNMWFEGVEEKTTTRARPLIPIPNRRSPD